MIYLSNFWSMMSLMICTATYSIAPGSGQRQGFDPTFLGTRRHEVQAGRDRSWHSGGGITPLVYITAISFWKNNQASLLLFIMQLCWIHDAKLVLTRRITSNILYRRSTYPITLTLSKTLCAGLWLILRSVNLSIGISKRFGWDIYVFLFLDMFVLTLS